MRIFEKEEIKTAEKVRLFPDASDMNIDEKAKSVITRLADEALSYEMTVIPATMYMEYARMGNRVHFESFYFERRNKLFSLLLGAIINGSGKYLDKLIDIAWAICEETSWIIPAHNTSKSGNMNDKCLPDRFDTVHYVDLFSAATGAVLALVYEFLKDDLDAATDGVLPERIEYEVGRRVLTPFLDYKMRWAERNQNNWVSWICSNVLTAAMVFYRENVELRDRTASLCAVYINRLGAKYAGDCGCNEGASYWSAAVGTVFDAAELIFDMTDGKTDLFGGEFLRRACRFGPDLCVDIEKRVFVNFADCGVHNTYSGSFIHRMGRRLSDRELCGFGSTAYFSENEREITAGISANTPYRTLKNLTEAPHEREKYTPASDAVYPDLGVAVIRRGSFTLAAKGGHNGESHNHNDVGHFVLYHEGEPVILDAGNLEYTKDTFGDKRYTIWTNRSDYHNLPILGGVTEKEGAEYRADRFSAGDGRVEIDFSSAYPCKEKCVRRIEVTRDKVTVETEVSCGVVHIFMLKTEPIIKGNTVILGKVKMTLSENEGIAFDTVDIADSPHMQGSFGVPRLYRLLVTAAELTAVFTEV